MKINYYFWLIFSFTTCLFFSCSDDTGGGVTGPVGELRFSNLTVTDLGNAGDASDVFLNYTLGSDLSILKELRFMISPVELSQTQASQVASANYQTLSTTESFQNYLDENLMDTDGNVIREEVTYNLYALALFNDTEIKSILSDPIIFSLENETIVTTPTLSGTFNAMEDITIAQDGTLYANGGGSNPSALYKVTPTGESSILSNQMSHAVGIALDDAGNIYASSFTSAIIKKITPTGEASDFISDNRLSGGGGVAIDNDGNLFNTFFATATLYKFKDGTLEAFTSSSAFNGPVGVTYDKERNKLYVASFNTGKIFHISATGEVTEIADTPATIGHISYANDHFYITGWREHQVYQVSLDGQIIETIGLGVDGQLDGGPDRARFSQPNGIEASADGKYVYVTQGNGKLRKLIMARTN